MIGRIIGLVACLLCAFPFFVLSGDKNSGEPLQFWSGDRTLKEKVRNVPEYNREMAMLYKKCAIAFLLTGIGFLILPLLGVILVCFDCTLGIWLAYRSYKKILAAYS